MAKSTGPILAVGGITLFNKWIGNDEGFDIRIVVGTGIAAGMLALFEHANSELAVGIAWIALVTSLLIKPATGNSAINNLLRLTQQTPVKAVKR